MDQGILTGPEIVREVCAGNIHIEGFDTSRIHSEDDSPMNPASYDLCLGSQVAVYKAVVALPRSYEYDFAGSAGPMNSHSVAIASRDDIERHRGDLIRANPNGVLDSKKENEVHVFLMNEERGWQVNPGVGYLMHTKEAVHTDKYVPIVDGKSSTGRLFVTAHVTAGYGDPGFDGEYTLEVVSTHRVVLYPGMRFCQIRFHTKVGKHLGYKGNYVGATSRGPVPSRSWKQFRKAGA